MELSTFVRELLKKYLTVKGLAWRYENEARIIRFEHGLLSIPGNFLRQVCFGLRTPRDDIELVTELARKYCGCTQFCRIVRGSTDFGIKAEEI